MTKNIQTTFGEESESDGRVATDGAVPEAVYRALRDEIVVGTLEPGRKFRIESICDRYSAGPTPVRDALARLTSEGLVSRADQREYLVLAVSNEEIRELVTTRCWLEELAFARSIALRDRTWEGRLRTAFERMSRVPRSTSATEYRINKDWEARHRAFHDALIANCDSRILLGYCRELRDRADRYRYLAAGDYSFPIDTVEQQHVEVMNFAIEGRTEEAISTLRQHYQVTWSIVEQAIKDARSS